MYFWSESPLLPCSSWPRVELPATASGSGPATAADPALSPRSLPAPAPRGGQRASRPGRRHRGLCFRCCAVPGVGTKNVSCAAGLPLPVVGGSGGEQDGAARPAAQVLAELGRHLRTPPFPGEPSASWSLKRPARPWQEGGAR